jgi:hypothetical protein
MYGSELVKAEAMKELGRNLAGASELFTLLRTAIFAAEQKSLCVWKRYITWRCFKMCTLFLSSFKRCRLGYTQQFLLLFVWV